MHDESNYDEAITKEDMVEFIDEYVVSFLGCEHENCADCCDLERCYKHAINQYEEHLDYDECHTDDEF